MNKRPKNKEKLVKHFQRKNGEKPGKRKLAKRATSKLFIPYQIPSGIEVFE